MPLPANNTPWPPKALDGITPKLAEWSAWLAGDPDLLRQAYQDTSARARVRPSQLAGGVVGAAARFWWGAPPADVNSQRAQLHIPLAADICQASADLLFGEPPTLTVPKDDGTVQGSAATTQDRIDKLVEGGLHQQLAEASEIGAALGTSFLRVTWDKAIDPTGPFLTTVHADAAWPEFRYGRLTAVTFWHVVARNGTTVLRHLERHELDSQGVGIVLHGLYEGTPDNLGRAVPLAEHPTTLPLAALVNADGAVSTLSPGLAVEMIANQRPQRRWRTHPVGANLGRSDLDGVEGPMDALDEAWSSWMRDLRLGKARILAARSMLEDLGPGRGAAFDVDREVYEAMNALATREGNGLPIEQVQFKIRVEEHARTCQELTETIIRSAGYSSQTFGEESDGAVTATEVHSRERRSFLTRSRKIRAQKPGVGRLVQKMLGVDREVFGNRTVEIIHPVVAFGDSVQESPEALARTAQLLWQAEAASTATLVGMVHPDWGDEEIKAEASAIRAERGMAVPDPIGQGEGDPVDPFAVPEQQ